MEHLTAILRSIQPYAIPITFVAVYVAEHVVPERKLLADLKHDALNTLFGVINLLVAVIAGYYLQKLLSYTSSNNFGLLSMLSNVAWLQLLSGFIILDIFMYWWHRANHEVGFLWQFHRFHHKDENLNSTSAVRFHAVEIALSYVIKFALFPLLGINVTIVVLYGTVLFPVIVFHHSNVRIPVEVDNFFRKLFVTPRMHRIHHSKIVAETNSNYGSVFPYWDLLFRSNTAKPVKEIAFGVD